MSRNVFISILGTSYYNETSYYCDSKENAIKTHFVQEAMLKTYSESFNKNDKAFIFLTEKAKETNWLSPAQKDNKYVKEGKSETYIGLQETLKALNLSFELNSIDIPDGNTEDEIWEIFTKVFEVLQRGDKVYFDITHAFRSLPMLVMVLINYAKFLKDIQVESITYGNYEGRDGDYSPILNLTSFSQLQDWTNAANNYINSGASENLNQVIRMEAKNLKGKYKQPLEKFAKEFSNFNNSILTVRGKLLYKGDDLNNLKGSLTTVKKQNKLIALNPIMEQIENRIKDFSKEDDEFYRGKMAVEYCMENNLWQQAYTLGQEHIISLLCKKFDFDYLIQENREIISKTIGIIQIERKEAAEFPEDKLHGELKNNIDKYRKVKNDSLIQEISSDFQRLTNYRNDFNHGGFIGSTNPNDFIKNFEKFYFSCLNVMNNN